MLDIINLNRQKLNQYNELVNNALLNLQTDVKSNCNFNHRNDGIEQNVLNCVNSLCEGEPPLSESTVMSTGEMTLVVSDEELNEHTRLLNKKHREVLETVYSWSISYMKNLISQNIATIHPLNLFTTGGEGVGKSFLTKILYQFLTKIFFYRNSSLDKPKFLLLVPTGVAAVSIDGTTIHSALYILVGYFRRNLRGLSNKMKSNCRSK